MLILDGKDKKDLMAEKEDLILPPDSLKQDLESQKTSEPPRLNKKILLSVGIALGFLVLLLGGYFAYAKIFLSPERIFTKMEKKLLDIKSFHFEGNFNQENISESNLKENPFNAFSLKIQGDYDGYDKENPRMQIIFNGTILSFSLKGEGRVFKKDVYFKLDEIPSIVSQFLQIDLSGLKGKWIKTTSEDYTKATSLTSTQEEKIKKLLDETKLYSKIERQKDEKVSGKTCFVFKVIIDKNALADFLIKYSEIVESPLGENEKNDLRKSLRENIGEVAVYFWIGKRDYYPYKIKTNLTFQEEGSSDQMRIDVEISLNNFNQKIEIEVPKDSKSLEEYLQEMMNKNYQNYLKSYQKQYEQYYKQQYPAY